MAPRLVLQDFLPYLLNRVGMKIGFMFSQDVEQYDVTLPMWRVLIELWHKGDHRLGELAERTSIDLSTLSRLVVSMQRKKLVVRRRSGADRRALSLTLTKKGVELTENVAPIALHYERLAMGGMSKAEVAQLKGLLRKAFANLEDARTAGAIVDTSTEPADGASAAKRMSLRRKRA
jgi:DNA-binding MarR family transcriptional regulator